MCDVAFVTKCHRNKEQCYQYAARSGHEPLSLCNRNQGSHTFAVTFRDAFDKPVLQTGFIVCSMKTQTIFLTTIILLSASPVVIGEMAASSTTDALQLRYVVASGKAQLSIIQDISAGERKSIANRDLLMEFELDEAPGAIAVEITRVKGSYEAHGMSQRLGSSGLKGQTFNLQKTDDYCVLQRSVTDSKLEIGVGQMIGGNYPVALALADIMPALPEDPVTLGSTWESSRDARFLEGWAWTQGRLISEHKVTDLGEKDGHTIVSVSSTSYAQLSDVEGGVVFSGDGELKRTAQWRFDATEGRLLSVSMEQETTGINTLPQGDIDVRQITKAQYSTE
jgi:hypothetical protein